ncbi:hypothetical protein EJ05DRAFT_481810 [Pseudovirgaria hyperparasitica]|uniref:Uncharacterized protein n=1 Tax=Pseudovirgaria hyperparasitica TaxID=470096 RepID=A0A6A6WL91_9PEZI|nr:uncharacterized protein EJ05DRAFT_481810 [Pseudovirgaria hyperparasitica]KAF2762943.1 hypothetical protein EJ05DRAFT_481810 [Pseudovirgaria hyperparasitica]
MITAGGGPMPLRYEAPPAGPKHKNGRIHRVLGTKFAGRLSCLDYPDRLHDDVYMGYYPAPPSNGDQIVVSWCGNRWPEDSFRLIHDPNYDENIEESDLNNIHNTYLSPFLLSIFLDSDFFEHDYEGDIDNWASAIQASSEEKFQGTINYS